MKKVNILLMAIACCGLSSIAAGQGFSQKALFLGNSYTAVNNLPQMIADVASSMGDTLFFDSNTPGGYRLMDHSTNATSLAKIGAGNWDYVILQEQSQYPSFPDWQVETDVFPYARMLDSIINANNPCAETVFYMTWGRKNGDASNCATWPPVCTYIGMDSLLNLRYRMMADSNNAILSPVGAVWKYLRQNVPALELYQADESHPSVAGTYAAACCFYTALFRKDPALITFNATLSPTDAAAIRTATRLVLYDSLMNWHIGEYDPVAAFVVTNAGGGQFSFTNNSLNATDYLWDFGDGSTSAAMNPTHTYAMSGSYTVRLRADSCDRSDSASQAVNVVTGIEHQTNDKIPLRVFPNPATRSITINHDASLSGGVYVICDYTGKPVLSGILDSVDTIINLDALADGVYIFRLIDELKHTFSVIKE